MEPQDQEEIAEMNSIIREIQTIYDAGTPMFTKDAIRKVGSELDVFQKGGASNGREITLKGINGADYTIFVGPPVLKSSKNKNQHLGGSTW